jgi:hypothetical protein
MRLVTTRQSLVEWWLHRTQSSFTCSRAGTGRLTLHSWVPQLPGDAGRRSKFILRSALSHLRFKLCVVRIATTSGCYTALLTSEVVENIAVLHKGGFNNGGHVTWRVGLLKQNSHCEDRPMSTLKLYLQSRSSCDECWWSDTGSSDTFFMSANVTARVYYRL